MKKSIFVLLCMFSFSFLSAEEMEFVTTLSSPMGTFAQLETVNPLQRVSASTINFSNSKSLGSRVTLKGAKVYIQTLALKNGTSLEGSGIPEYRIQSSLRVSSGGSVIGSRLIGKEVDFSLASAAQSKVNSTLYMDNATVRGAKTDQLNIPSKVETSGTGEDVTLEWSNIYKRDYASDGSSTGNTYTSFLLKSKLAPGEGCVPSANYTLTDRATMQELYRTNRSSFCDQTYGWYKDNKYSCPSNLTEPKKCIDSYKTPGGGEKSTYFTRDVSIIESCLDVYANGITYESLENLDERYRSYFPWKYQNENIKDWVLLPNSFMMISLSGCKVISIDIEDAPAYCDNVLKAREPGLYGIFASVIYNITGNAGTYYFIAKVGYCSVNEEDTFYKADVTCCP